MSEHTPSDAQPVAWLVDRLDRDGKAHLYLPLLRSTEEVERYRRHNPDERLAPLYSQAALDAERQKREAAERDVEAAEASRAKANERIAEMEAAIAHPTNKMLDAVAKELRETWGTNIDEPKPCPIGWRNTWRAVALPVAQAALTNIEKERDDG